MSVLYVVCVCGVCVCVVCRCRYVWICICIVYRMIPGSENVWGDTQQYGDTVTFRAALKTVGKNFKHMSSTDVQEYINQCENCSLQDISTKQSIRMQYELSEGFMDLKEQRQLH